MKSLCWLAGLGLLAGLIVVTHSGAQDRSQDNSPVAADDRAAIDALNAEFTRAFNEGDAEALAALFAEDARMTDEFGRTVEGRDLIHEALSRYFESAPGTKVVLRTDSVTFLTPDVAIEEGASQLQLPDAATEEDYIPYTSIYVKQNGRWLHSILRDYFIPSDAAAPGGAEALQELAWMVGEWIEEGSESRTVSTCEWAQNEHFLVWNYTVEIEGANAPGGTTWIGWDPLTGQIKSWVFDAEGGHGEATWTRFGDDQWVVKAAGVLGDGRVASATQYVTRMSDDMASWTSVDRVAGGEVQPDMSEYVIVRNPPQPAAGTDTAESSDGERSQP